MRKIFVLVQLLLAVQFVCAQKTSGKAIYSIIPIENEVKLTDPIDIHAKKMVDRAMLLAKDFEYILKFKGDISSYEKVPSLNNEKAGNAYYLNLAEAITGLGVHYRNEVKNLHLWQLNLSGKEYLITDGIEYEGIITNEKKKVSGLNCTKAYLKCNVCDNDKKVEVWFTSEIPLSIGPEGYSGLPGLIVQVNKKSHMVRLKQMEFTDSNKVEISEPKKGERVTLEKYKQLSNAARERARTN